MRRRATLAAPPLSETQPMHRRDHARLSLRDACGCRELSPECDGGRARETRGARKSRESDEQPYRRSWPRSGAVVSKRPARSMEGVGDDSMTDWRTGQMSEDRQLVEVRGGAFRGALGRESRGHGSTEGRCHRTAWWRGHVHKRLPITCPRWLLTARNLGSPRVWPHPRFAVVRPCRRAL
jgi:hypothetical protein